MADGIETYANGVVKLDELSGPTTLGYIFGGLAANAPNTRFVPGTASAASNLIFEVVLTPVPEPSAIWLAAMLVGLFIPGRRIATPIATPVIPTR